jgi:hypothetical protein
MIEINGQTHRLTEKMKDYQTNGQTRRYSLSGKLAGKLHTTI